MKFTFKYSGGFGGLRGQLNGDSNDLDEQYKKSIEAVPAFDAGTLAKPNPLAKDMQKYTLTVDEDGRQHNLTFTDDNMPAELEPLVNHLKDKADLA